MINRNPDFELPSISGEWGEIPTIDPVDTKAPKEIVAKLLIPGDGPEVAAGGIVSAYYTGWLWDGKPFDSSFNHGDGPSTFNLNQVIVGWKDGLPGSRVGDRVLLIVPPEYGYGASPREGIPANSTLVFVIDIAAVPGADLAPLEGATEQDVELPDGVIVEGALGAQPVIGFAEDATPPTEAIELVLAEGSGKVITPEDTVLYHHTGVFWGNPSAADSTWQTAPAVTPARDAVFLGHRVGDRLLFIFPGEGDNPAQVSIADIVDAVPAS